MNEVCHDFSVRWYQANFHDTLVQRKKKKAIAVWHRRAGKDETLMKAFRDMSNPREGGRVGTYWHCLPQYEQGRKALWDGVDPRSGKTRVERIFPKEAGFVHDQQKMFVKMPWGSTWQLIGSDRYDATVGSGPVGIGYSEWALSNPSAYAYHKPMLQETDGTAAFITTPRGQNHAKTMYDNAVEDDDWFAELLTVNDTGILTPAQLTEELKDYQALWGLDMGLAYFEQEYLCSWSGATVGSYFGAEMSRAEREGRIDTCPIDEMYPVHCVMDLGKAANNPVWLFQVVQGALHVVGFYSPRSENLDDWCMDLREMGFNGTTYVPHDIMVTEWGTDKTRYARLEQHGMSPERVARVSVADGLQAGRMAIDAALFDRKGCGNGIEGLKSYRRDWDDERKTFRETPVKDWAEHIGSSWRYLGLAWREVVPPPERQPVQKELVYAVQPGGRIVGNMTVKEAVDAMVRRRRLDDG
jgi:phage terminase large subunit